MNRIITIMLFGLLMPFSQISAQNPVALSFSPSSFSGSAGQSVSVDVLVTDYTNIVGLQYYFKWDESIMRFDSASSILGTDDSNPSPPDPNFVKPGEISVIFDNAKPDELFMNFLHTNSLDNSDLTFPAGTKLYTAHFTILAAGSTNIDFICGDATHICEVIHPASSGSYAPLIPFEITSTEGAGSINITAASISGASGDTKCVPISVTGFSNVKDFATTLNYDATKLSFVAPISNINAEVAGLDASDFNTATAGQIALNWSNASAQSIGNDAVLFEACFELTGNSGTSTDITFNSSSATSGSNQAMPVIENSGTVEITAAADFQILIDDVPACPGASHVCVPVRVKGFTNITGLQWDMVFDDSQISTVTVENINTPDAEGFALLPSNPASNRARVLGISDYPDGTSNPKVGSNLPDNEILFDICFDVVDGFSLISIPEESIVVTTDDVNGESIDLTVSVKSGSLGTTGGAPTLSANVSDVVCGGTSTGAIDLTVSGGVPDYTYAWTPAATTEDLSSLSAGTYTVTVTDNCGQTVSGSYVVASLNAPLVVTGTTTNASNNSAADGKITLNVSGGLANYTYAWTPNIDPNAVVAGNYSVVVTDANNCTATASFTVAANQVDLVLNPSKDQILDVNCFGECTGAINPGYDGGVGNVTATWSTNSAVTTPNISGLCAGEHCVTMTDGVTTIVECYTVSQPSAPLSVTANMTPQSVSGGAADGAIALVVSGGSPDYTFSWANFPSVTTDTLSNLEAGSYPVTVMDARGCTFVENYNLPGGDPLVIGASVVNNESCGGANDGSINLEVTGGTINYTYLWSDGSTAPNRAGLAPNDYTVTVTDANNLTDTKTFTIGAAIPIVIAVDNIVTVREGNDGAILLNISGGMPDYSYAWSSSTFSTFAATTKNISDLEMGSYTVLVTDSKGCTESRTFVVGGTFGFGNVDITNIDCFGDNTGKIHVTINAGEPPFTYMWSNGDTTRDIYDLVAGNYCLTVTDNLGATITDCWDVTQPASGLNIEVTSVQHVVGPTQGSINITVTGGTKPYTYIWSHGPTSEDVIDLQKGNYNVVVTDANGCIMSSGDIEINAPFVANEPELNGPKCNGDCDGSISFVLYGGQPPYSVKWSNAVEKTISLNGPNTIAIDGLCANTYGVTVTDSEGSIFTNSFTLTEPTALTIAHTVDTDNAVIDITPAGGVAPYTYLWSRNGEKDEDLINVEPGVHSYSVTVTDENGCKEVKSITADIPQLKIEVVSIVKPVCPDDKTGSILINITGGAKPYTFDWSNGSTSQNLLNVPAGTYLITVKDVNGNSNSLSIKLDAESDLKATLQMTNFPTGPNSCDASAFVATTGGQAPYTYSWTNDGANLTGNTETASGICAGELCVEVTDNVGCAMTVCYSVPATTILEITSLSKRTPISCYEECDGSLQVIASGGTPPYTYKWSNQATTQIVSGLCADVYSVTVTDINGRQDTKTFEMEEPNALDLLFNVEPPSVVGGSDGSAEVEVSGGTPPYNFEWNDSDCNSAKCDDFASGEHWVLVIDGRGCEETGSVEVPTETVPCFSASLIMTLDGTHDGRNDFFRVRCIEGTNNRLTIYNRWGQLVYETENYQNDWNGVDLKGNPVAEGAYYYVLEVTTAGGGGDQYKGHITILK